MPVARKSASEFAFFNKAHAPPIWIIFDKLPVPPYSDSKYDCSTMAGNVIKPPNAPFHRNVLFIIAVTGISTPGATFVTNLEHSRWIASDQ